MARKRNDPVTTLSEPSLAHDGRGVVRHNERVYFVAGALPEEELVFTPFHKQRGSYNGRLEEIIKPNADRVEPPCEYFGVCGGCSTQHLSPTAQLKFKAQTLADNLQRIGQVTPEQWLEPITSDWTHYRRKARLGVKFVPKKGGVLVGFREKGTAYLTSLKSCLTLDKRIGDLLPPLHELVEGLNAPNRIPQIEVAAAEEAVALVIRNLEAMTEEDMVLLEEFAKKNEVHVLLQPAGPDSIFPVWPKQPEALYYLMPEFDLKLEFRASDFIQVNEPMNRKMVSLTVEFLELSEQDHVLDLFCGLGNFSLAVARAGASVVGVEGEQAMVDQAKHNTQLNGIDNAEFLAANLHLEGAEKGLPASGFNKLLLDPPRSGAQLIISEYVPILKPERIVYVSCNPATLARDANILVNHHGYKLLSAGAIDMFPHTAHVESIAVFERA
ncbi:MAG: 23S rRNA (uracil1939-C5)-methyltransferase [Saprospiraceae bacterium]|jgi:23S rRNA (uracil1939-C5)-methyltransferase